MSTQIVSALKDTDLIYSLNNYDNTNDAETDTVERANYIRIFGKDVTHARISSKDIVHSTSMGNLDVRRAHNKRSLHHGQKKKSFLYVESNFVLQRCFLSYHQHTRYIYHIRLSIVTHNFEELITHLIRK